MRKIIIVGIMTLVLACSNEDQIPYCDLEVFPQSGSLYTNFFFKVKNYGDLNNLPMSLQFRIDFQGDSIWDTEFGSSKEWAWKYSVEGEYSPRVEIMDPDGNTSQVEILVTVDDLNTKPKAYLFTNLTFTSLSTPIILDGSYSWDFEEHIEQLLFTWDFDGIDGWDTESTRNPIFTARFSQPGQKKIRMRVTDSHQAFDDDESSITVVNSFHSYDKLVDHRDGNQYPIVKIGERWWMAQNLRYGSVVNSQSSPQDNGTVEAFVLNDQIDNLHKYGALYMWSEAMSHSYKEPAKGVCPDNWHLPSDKEWDNLEIMLGATGNSDFLNTWSRYEPIGDSLRIDGGSGMEIGLYGYVSSDRRHIGLGSQTVFWSSTFDDGKVITRSIGSESSGVYKSSRATNNSFYLRCIKDE